MKKKYLMRDFLNMFANITGRHGKTQDISAAQALNLQKDYAAQLCKEENPSHPPYVDIAAQLASSKNEIAFAALYYLQKIALNEPQYVSEILPLLQNFAAKNPHFAFQTDLQQIIKQLESYIPD